MPKSKNRSLLRIILSALVLTSNLTLPVYSQVNTPIEVNHTSEATESTGFLPSELGQIQESYIPDPSYQGPVIVHLKTPHGHYESALNVKKIIHYLQDHHDITLLFAEGANGRLHPEYLDFFPEPSLNEKVSDYLAKEGELTGVDLALLPGSHNSRRALEALGIENSDLYHRAYTAFRDVLNHSKSANSEMEARKLLLDREASKILPPELRDLIGVWQKFHSEHSDLSAVVKLLTKESKKLLGLDLKDPISQFEWPQLSRFTALESLQTQLAGIKEQTEKQHLKHWLRERKLPTQIVARMTDKKTNQPRALLEHFYHKTHSFGFRFKNFPQTTIKCHAAILQNELDAPALYSETHKLFDALFKIHIKTTEQGRLLDHYKTHFLIQKLLQLELTPGEWHELKQRRSFVHDPLLAAASRFYKISTLREKVFLNKIESTLQNRPPQTVLLVTGGFHADGMAELFRKKGLAYIQITPKMTSAGDSLLYHEIMLRTAHLEKPGFTESAIQINEFLGPYAKPYLRSEFKKVQRALQSVTTPDRLAVRFISPYFADRGSAFNPSKTLFDAAFHGTSFPRAEMRASPTPVSAATLGTAEKELLVDYLKDLTEKITHQLPRRHKKYHVTYHADEGWEKHNILKFYNWDWKNKTSFYRSFYFIPLTLQSKRKPEEQRIYHILFYLSGAQQRLALQIFRIQDRGIATDLNILQYPPGESFRTAKENNYRALPLSLPNFLAEFPIEEEKRIYLRNLVNEFVVDRAEDGRMSGGVSLGDILQAQTKKSQVEKHLKVVATENLSDVLTELQFEKGSPFSLTPVPAVISFGKMRRKSHLLTEILNSKLAHAFVHLPPFSQGKTLVWVPAEGEILSRKLPPQEVDDALIMLRNSYDPRLSVVVDAETYEDPNAVDALTKRLTDFLLLYVHSQPKISIHLIVMPEDQASGKAKLLTQHLREKITQALNRSEIRHSIPQLNANPIEAAYPVRFAVALTAAYPFMGTNWDARAMRRYRGYLESLLEWAWQRQTAQQGVEAIQDHNKDGLGISQNEIRNIPISLHVDLKTLNPRDRDDLKKRLQQLPIGSVLTAYVDIRARGSQQDILTPLIRELPAGQIHYFRVSYLEKISAAAIQKQQQRALKIGIQSQNSALLLPNLDVLEASRNENLEESLDSFGFVFQFNPRQVAKKYRNLKGLSAAVLGEVLKAALLDRNLQTAYLAQSTAQGFFTQQAGVFLLQESWIQARVQQELLASAA